MKCCFDFIKRGVLLLIFLLSFPDSNAQNVSEKWEHFILKDEGTRIKNNDYLLLSSSDPLIANEIERLGFKIIRKLDKQNFIVSNGEDRSYPYSLYNVNNKWKLSSNISSNSPYLNITVLNEEDFSKAYKSMVTNKVYSKIFKVQPAEGMMERLVNDPNVIAVEASSINAIPEAPQLDYDFTVNTINMVKQRFPSLTGEGLTVSVKEDEYRTSDIDLKNRHVDSGIGSEILSGHATDMATLIAGGGNTAPTSFGVAPQAKIATSDFYNLFPDPVEVYNDLNITVQNHSYGVSINNTYTAEASAYDDIVFNNPELIHVFSSGNAGALGSTEGVYKDINYYANITGGFKMAKNIITVGAADSLLERQVLVSRGPAYDGRVKPEIVAYSQSGSSASAALVSGTTLLLQQFYLNKYSELPGSALIKSIILNTANDLGKDHVDFTFGYGNLDAYEAVKTIEEERFIKGKINHGEILSFPLDIPANTHELKVMLVWTDPAANPNSNKALINDLDLSVVNNENEFLPWVLNSYPHIDSLTELAERQKDHLNNIEQVTIDKPTAGSYTIHIKGFDIPKGPQEFFIAYQIKENNAFSWTYPVAGDNMPFDGERVNFLRWNSTFDRMGAISYKLNGTTEWISITESAALSQSYFSWAIPDTFATAQVKMNIEGKEFISEEFVISYPVKLNVGFNCADSILLSWNTIENASSYIIYNLTNDELVNYKSISDTTIIVYEDEISSSFFAVTPVINDLQGIRSLTYDYNLQGVNCYISSFLINQTENNNVEAILSLGTSYQVKEVVFESLNEAGVFTEEITIPADSRTTYTYSDKDIRDGFNTYRARIVFKGGSEIVTEEFSIFLLHSRKYVVYPNPVDAASDYLIIYLKEYKYGEAIFTLFNHRGQLVYQEYLLSERSYLDLANLTEGIYFFRLEGPELSSEGKIIIYN